MSPRLLLPFVVLLVALVLGGIYLFTAQSDTAPTAATSARTATNAPSGSRPALPDPVEEELAASASDGAARANRTEIETAPSARNSSANSSPAASPAELTGVVHNVAGAPVAGATVKVVGAGAGGLAIPIDVFDNWLGGGENKGVTTDAQGRFRFPGVSSGRQRVAIRAAAYAPFDTSEVVVPAGASHDMGVVTLEAGGVLSGRVIDQRGAGVAGAQLRRVLEPAAGALVFFDGGGVAPSVELALTDASGAFRIDTLPVGEFKLRAWHAEHPDQFAHVAVAFPGEVVAPLTIVLDPSASISGRVLGAPSGAVSDMAVRAAPKRSGAGGFEIDLDFDFATGANPQGGEARIAKVAPDGSFQVRGLRRDKDYVLTLKRAQRDENVMFGSQLSSRVEARAGATGVELAYRPESSVAFQVIDARTRQPIEQLDVKAGVEFPVPIEGRAGARLGHYPEGRVRAGKLRPRNPADRLTLRVESVGYRTWSRSDIALAEGAELDLGVIELEPTPIVRVSVVADATGEPVKGARVALHKVREPSGGGPFSVSRSISVSAGDGDPSGAEFDELDFDGNGVRSARTDERGEVRLTSFEGERCELLVSHTAFAPQRSAPFVCGAAGDELTLRLHTGGTALVKLLDASGAPLAGHQIDHRDAGPSSRGSLNFGPGASASSVTDANGVARFERLASGLHAFRPAKRQGGAAFGGAMVVFAGAGDQDEGWVELEVREGESSVLTLQAPLEVVVRGRVREAGQALSGASVTLEKKPAAGAPRMPALPFGDGPRARTDSRGEYELTGVAPGDYILNVSHSARAMPTELALRVGERDVQQDVELSLAIIEGRVVDAAGEPVSGARVWAERDDSGGQTTQRVRMVFASDSGGLGMIGGDGSSPEVFSDGDGRFSLRGVVTDAKLVVRSEGKGLQPARSAPLELSENEVERGVELVMKQAGQAEVSAFRSDGSPANMVLVVAVPDGGAGAPSDRKTAFIQDSGKTTLDGLAPGAWKISARPMGPAGGGSSAPTEQIVQIKPGESTAVRFDMP